MHCLNLSKYMYLLLGLWIVFLYQFILLIHYLLKNFFDSYCINILILQKLRLWRYLTCFFANNSIWSGYFFSFLILDLHFLIPAVTAKFSNPIVRLAVAKKMSVHKAKTEIETQLLIAETKISDCSIQFEIIQGLFNSIGL